MRVFGLAAWRGGSAFAARALSAVAAAAPAAGPLGAALTAALRPPMLQQLAENGHASVEQAVSSSVARDLRDEIGLLHEGGVLLPNATHLVRPAAGGRGGGAGPQPQRTTEVREYLYKERILEQELHLLVDDAVEGGDTLRDALPALTELYRSGAPALRAVLAAGFPHLGLTRAAVKLQRNVGGGGCFPLHFDTAAELDGRQITAILYLNESWMPEHGGELALYPLTQPPVLYPPTLGRLVLFSSHTMLHRVLPSAAPRACLTVWLSGTRDSAAAGDREDFPPDPADPDPSLLRPPLLQHAAKLLLARDWEASLVESHAPSAQRDRVQAELRAEVALIERLLGTRVEALRRRLAEGLRPRMHWL